MFIQFEESKTELDTRLADLDNKVNEIEKNKLALDGYVSWLNSSIKSMKENHINLETKLTSRLTELEPIFANNFAEHDKNKKKIEFIKSHTNEINGKMREILESIMNSK